MLSRSFRKIAGVSLELAILAAVALRFVIFCYQPAFGHDEACLGVNVLDRTFRGLLKPLDFNQTAPPLFLITTKALILVLGPAEWVFRLLPLLASVATVILVGLIARRMLGTVEAMVAISLAAFCPLGLSYSNIFKPYAADALATAILFWLVLPILENPQPLRPWNALWMAGIVSLLFSEPAVFVLTGFVFVFLLDGRFHSAQMVRRWTIISTSWGLLFLALYLTLYKPVSDSPYMHRFWADILTGSVRERAYSALWNLFGSELIASGLPADLAFLLAVGGLFAVGRKLGRSYAVLLVSPYAILLVAYALGRYPVYERLVLFISPVLFLLLASAVSALINPLRGCWKFLAVAAIPICGLIFLYRSWPVWPTWSDHVRTVLARQLMESHSAEPVFILPRAIPSWLVYTNSWSSDPSRFSWFASMYRLGSPAFGDTPSRHGRSFESASGLASRSAGHLQLLGLYSGVENRAAVLIREVADSGWAEHEVRRLREIAKPCAWIYSLDARKGERAALTEALTESEGAILFPVRLSHEPGAPASLERVCWNQ